jgi:hypothetical protein
LIGTEGAGGDLDLMGKANIGAIPAGGAATDEIQKSLMFSV